MGDRREAENKLQGCGGWKRSFWWILLGETKPSGPKQICKRDGMWRFFWFDLGLLSCLWIALFYAFVNNCSHFAQEWKKLIEFALNSCEYKFRNSMKVSHSTAYQTNLCCFKSHLWFLQSSDFCVWRHFNNTQYYCSIWLQGHKLIKRTKSSVCSQGRLMNSDWDGFSDRLSNVCLVKRYCYKPHIVKTICNFQKIENIVKLKNLVLAAELTACYLLHNNSQLSPPGPGPNKNRAQLSPGDYWKSRILVCKLLKTAFSVREPSHFSATSNSTHHEQHPPTALPWRTPMFHVSISASSC